MIRIISIYRVFPPHKDDPIVQRQIISINPIVESQINSMAEKDRLEFFHLKIYGGGLNYLWAFFRLLFLTIKVRPQIIHGHYSYCGFLAGIIPFTKSICSLMGSDLLAESAIMKKITLFFARKVWTKVIVKSDQMQKICPQAMVIPNGVNFDIFKPIDKTIACGKVGLDITKFHVISVVAKESAVKNLQLAKDSVALLSDVSCEYHIVSNLGHEELTNYYNAADVLLVTSFHEGSPNVVKEALACNCPVISTDVGDVKKIIENIDNCYLAQRDAYDFADKIRKIYLSKQRTNSREKITHLKSDVIAKKLIEIYTSI